MRTRLPQFLKHKIQPSSICNSIEDRVVTHDCVIDYRKDASSEDKVHSGRGEIIGGKRLQSHMV